VQQEGNICQSAIKHMLSLEMEFSVLHGAEVTAKGNGLSWVDVAGLPPQARLCCCVTIVWCACCCKCCRLAAEDASLVGVKVYVVYLQQHTSKQYRTCGSVGIPCHGDAASSASTPHVWRWSTSNLKLLRSTPTGYSR
jgi:hypothetical protein